MYIKRSLGRYQIVIPFRKERHELSEKEIARCGRSIMETHILGVRDGLVKQLQEMKSHLRQIVQLASADISREAIGKVLNAKVANWLEIYQGAWQNSPFRTLNDFDLLMFSLAENPQQIFESIAKGLRGFPHYISWGIFPSPDDPGQLKIFLIFSRGLKYVPHENIGDINDTACFNLRKEIESIFKKALEITDLFSKLKINIMGSESTLPKAKIEDALAYAPLELEEILDYRPDLVLDKTNTDERIWSTNNGSYLDSAEIEILIKHLVKEPGRTKFDLETQARRKKIEPLIAPALKILSRTKYVLIDLDHICFFDSSQKLIHKDELTEKEKRRMLSGHSVGARKRAKTEEAEKEVFDDIMIPFDRTMDPSYAYGLIDMIFSQLLAEAEASCRKDDPYILKKLQQEIKARYGKEVLISSENKFIALDFNNHSAKQVYIPERLFVIERILADLPRWILDFLPSKIFLHELIDEGTGIITIYDDPEALGGNLVADHKIDEMIFPLSYIFSMFRKENRQKTFDQVAQDIARNYFYKVLPPAKQNEYSELIQKSKDLPRSFSILRKRLGWKKIKYSEMPPELKRVVLSDFAIQFGDFIRGNLAPDNIRSDFFEKLPKLKPSRNPEIERKERPPRPSVEPKTEAPIAVSSDLRLATFNYKDWPDLSHYLWLDPKTFNSAEIRSKAILYMLLRSIDALQKNLVDKAYLAWFGRNFFNLFQKIGFADQKRLLAGHPDQIKAVLENVPDLKLIEFLSVFLRKLKPAEIKDLFMLEIFPSSALVPFLKHEPKYQILLPEKSPYLKACGEHPKIDLSDFSLVPDKKVRAINYGTQKYREALALSHLSFSERIEYFDKNLVGSRTIEGNEWKADIYGHLKRVESDELVAKMVVSNMWLFYFIYKNNSSYSENMRIGNIKKIIFEENRDFFLEFYGHIRLPFLAQVTKDELASLAVKLPPEYSSDIMTDVEKYLVLEEGLARVEISDLDRISDGNGELCRKVLTENGYLDEQTGALKLEFGESSRHNNLFWGRAEEILSWDKKNEIYQYLEKTVSNARKTPLRSHPSYMEFLRRVEKLQIEEINMDYTRKGNRTIARLKLPELNKEVEARAIAAYLDVNLDKIIDAGAYNIVCKILGVEPETDLSEVKELYRRLAFMFHSDRNPGDEKAVMIFKLLKQAWSRFEKIHTKLYG